MDLNRIALPDVPLWSETRWNGCYNAEQRVGLFLHAGRLRNNLDWWWAQTAVYLPGGRVAVERSWVRDTHDRGVKTASLELSVEDVGWSSRFDGIAELTTTAALGRSARGSSAPSVPMTFEVFADGSRPWWDMLAGVSTTQDFGDMHVEQMGKSTGILQVAGEQFRLDGVSYYDHSSGPRDWTDFHSHHFAMIEMPEYTIHVGRVYLSPTEERRGGGVSFTKDGTMQRVSRSDMPRQADAFGGPHQFDWLSKVAGEELVFRVEVEHTFPATITLDNDNINGTDWELDGDPLFLSECQVKVTAPDGAVGYGHIERSNRRSCLTRPE